MGGFAEMIVAMMIATIALTAFIGVVAYEASQDHIRCDVSTAFLSDLKIVDDKIVGVDNEYINDECAKNAYRSMVISVKVVGFENVQSLRLGTSTDNCETVYANGTVNIPCPDGKVVTAMYEVVAFV